MLKISQFSESTKGFIGFKGKEPIHIKGNKAYIQAPYSDVGICIKLEDILLVKL